MTRSRGPTHGSRGAEPRTRLRADAERNRQRVVKAATEVFAEQGIGAPVADIAARAGVGNATVFRAYPTKSDLLVEVAVGWLVEMERVTCDAAHARDPGAAVRTLIEFVFERLRTDRLAADMFRLGEMTEEVEGARRRVMACWSTVLARAAAAGIVRADVTFDDLSVLVVGSAERLSELGVSDAETWRRFAGFVLAAVAC